MVYVCAVKPLGAIGQIALPPRDPDRAQAFYRDALGLPFLFRYGKLVFFDCGGVRLLIDGLGEGRPAARLYFRPDDMEESHATLGSRGVAFDGPPHLIAKMPDHDLWMVFFKDPDGNQLALMEERYGGDAAP